MGNLKYQVAIEKWAPQWFLDGCEHAPVATCAVVMVIANLLAAGLVLGLSGPGTESFMLIALGVLYGSFKTYTLHVDVKVIEQHYADKIDAIKRGETDES